MTTMPGPGRLRVLVTGGAGFIGSAVCRHLVQQTQAIVVNLDKLTYSANLASLRSIEDNPKYSFVKLDVAEQEKLTALLTGFQPDTIIHLAAETHVDRSIDSARPFVETNIVGTYCLLEAARTYWGRLPAGPREHFRLLHVSTDEVYGSLALFEAPFDELKRYDPSSPYAASKAASDHLVSAWHRTYGLPTLISNCSNNFGPYQFPEKLIPLTILNAIEQRPIQVYGAGQNVRDWLFVEDHARALLDIVQNGKVGQTYNVGARNERTNLSVVELICDLVDSLKPGRARCRTLINFVTDRPGHDLRYAIDPSRIEQQLAWHPHLSFDDALLQTVAWYCDNPNWWQPLRQTIYQGERLGVAAVT